MERAEVGHRARHLVDGFEMDFPGVSMLSRRGFDRFDILLGGEWPSDLGENSSSSRLA